MVLTYPQFLVAVMRVNSVLPRDHCGFGLSHAIERCRPDLAELIRDVPGLDPYSATDPTDDVFAACYDWLADHW